MFLQREKKYLDQLHIQRKRTSFLTDGVQSIYNFRQLSTLEEREKELLSKVESIRLLKGKLLKAQQEQIEQATLELGKHARALRDFLASASELDFVKATKLLPQLSATATQAG